MRKILALFLWFLPGSNEPKPHTLHIGDYWQKEWVPDHVVTWGHGDSLDGCLVVDKGGKLWICKPQPEPPPGSIIFGQ